MLQDVLCTSVFNFQCFELGSPKPPVFKTATSENKCGCSQLPVISSDEEFGDFTSGSSDNYIPDEAET
jgi:hypothetical protein